MEIQATIKSIEILNKNLPVFYGVLGSVLLINLIFMIVFLIVIKGLFKTWNKQNKKFIEQMSNNLLLATENSKITAEQNNKSIKLIQEMQKDYNTFILSLASNAKEKSIINFVEKIENTQQNYASQEKQAPKKPSENINKALENAKKIDTVLKTETIELPIPEDDGYWETEAEKKFKEKNGIVEY